MRGCPWALTVKCATVALMLTAQLAGQSGAQTRGVSLVEQLESGSRWTETTRFRMRSVCMDDGIPKTPETKVVHFTIDHELTALLRGGMRQITSTVREIDSRIWAGEVAEGQAQVILDEELFPVQGRQFMTTLSAEGQVTASDADPSLFVTGIDGLLIPLMLNTVHAFPAEPVPLRAPWGFRCNLPGIPQLHLGVSSEIASGERRDGGIAHLVRNVHLRLDEALRVNFKPDVMDSVELSLTQMTLQMRMVQDFALESGHSLGWRGRGTAYQRWMPLNREGEMDADTPPSEWNVTFEFETEVQFEE